MQEFSVVIPSPIENLSLPNPELLTYYKNLADRVWWLDEEVSDYTLELSRLILMWNLEDKGKSIEERKPIRIMFCSYGGALDINTALISLIKLSKTPIYGYNMGYACSAGCFIFMACHKRYALNGSYFLVHKGSGGFSGTFDQVSAEMDEYARKMEELAVFILDNSKIEENTLIEHMMTEWYLSSDEALACGMCDYIISDIDEVV